MLSELCIRLLMLCKMSELFKNTQWEIIHPASSEGVGSASLPYAGEQKGREQPRGRSDSVQDHPLIVFMWVRTEREYKIPENNTFMG